MEVNACAHRGELVCRRRRTRVHAEANACACRGERVCCWEQTRICPSGRTNAFARRNLHVQYMYTLKKAKGNARALVHIYNTCSCLCNVKLTSNFRCLTPVYTYGNVMSKGRSQTARRQKCSLAVTNTHSHAERNVFTHGGKCVHSWRQPRSHAETNAFAREGKRVRMQRRTRWHAEANRTRSCYTLH